MISRKKQALDPETKKTRHKHKLSGKPLSECNSFFLSFSSSTSVPEQNAYPRLTIGHHQAKKTGFLGSQAVPVSASICSMHHFFTECLRKSSPKLRMCRRTDSAQRSASDGARTRSAQRDKTVLALSSCTHTNVSWTDPMAMDNYLLPWPLAFSHYCGCMHL